jgi:hypothetical protein
MRLRPKASIINDVPIVAAPSAIACRFKHPSKQYEHYPETEGINNTRGDQRAQGEDASSI